MVKTNHQWIVTAPASAQRHVAAPDMATSDIAVEAAREALAQRGIPASELDAIIVCTVTPDMLFPARPAWCRIVSARRKPGASIS